MVGKEVTVRRVSVWQWWLHVTLCVTVLLLRALNLPCWGPPPTGVPGPVKCSSFQISGKRILGFMPHCQSLPMIDVWFYDCSKQVSTSSDEHFASPQSRSPRTPVLRARSSSRRFCKGHPTWDTMPCRESSSTWCRKASSTPPRYSAIGFFILDEDLWLSAHI